MMAAGIADVIDLVSSDDEHTPFPRVRRRGHSGREVRQDSRTLSPEPTLAPQSQAFDNAARPARMPAISTATAITPLGPVYDGDAVGGAEMFGHDDMLNFDDFFMPGAFAEDEMAAAEPREPTPLREGRMIVIDGEEVFIPDSPATAGRQHPHAQGQEDLGGDAAYHRETTDFTADVCLKRVLPMFPDIDHEYIIRLYNDYDAQGTEAIPGGARLEAIVEKLLSGEQYPRQARQAPQRKRKRDDDATDQQSRRWEGPDREVAPPVFKGAMSSILKAEFPQFTKIAIARELLAKHHLYPTYLALAELKDNSDVNKKWSGRPLKHPTSADALAEHCGWPAMIDELEAARKHVKSLRRQRVIEDAKKWAEKENLQRAIDAGETAECQACFDDLPMNRQIHCNGDTAHFTCFDCAVAYVKSEVGDSRCKVLCTAGCGASFARAQLHLLEDKELLEKLEQLQQEKDIRDAALDDLEECPFCDYKAILPPVEVDFEFRCANVECEIVSCRRCKAVSHIPMSCEEHAKEHKLSSRHKIEEAMTAALIRNCGKCKKGFIKEYGCNKMSCPSCGNLQCYVCSASLKDYAHFDQTPGGQSGSKGSKCPLFDNVEERHEREIREAEAAARAEVINDNPGVSVQDLEIKVSDAVQKATDERVKRAGAVPGGIPPGYGRPPAAVGNPAGLYMHDRIRRRLRDRANDLEAAMLDLDAYRELFRPEMVQARLRRRLDMLRNDNALREEVRNLRQYNHDVATGPGHAPARALQAMDGIRQRALRVEGQPILPHPPAADERAFHFGGHNNEDQFDEGDNGINMHRLMFAPPPRVPIGVPPVRAPPVRDPGHALELPTAHDRIQQLQNRLQLLRHQRDQAAPAAHMQAQRPERVAINAEALERLERAQLQAGQRFDIQR